MGATPSVAVADVPGAPAAHGTVVLCLADLNCQLALAAGIGGPALGGVSSEGRTVAGVPDAVGGFQGHGHRSFRLN